MTNKFTTGSVLFPDGGYTLIQFATKCRFHSDPIRQAGINH
ncbi:hypothetical protein NSS94_23980 [Paenibacillus sp. FSL L8-0644]